MAEILTQKSNEFKLNWEQFSYDYEKPINEGKTKKVLKVFDSKWVD